ncbi:hypothetical protein GCM10028807_01110 [Spirosoma daeguense]
MKPARTGTGDGTSWANASSDLQAMIDRVSSLGVNPQVWVAKGVYKPVGIGNADRTVSFILRSGVAIYGGFNGTETNLSGRPTTLPSSTTLSGNIGDPSSSSDNSYHVIRNIGPLTDNLRLDGLVIADGRADGNFQDIVENGRVTGSIYHSEGGGLYNHVTSIQSTTLTINNCLFINNYSRSTAGALLNTASNGIQSVVNCSATTFDDNTAMFGGGAVFNGNYLYDSGNQRYYGNQGASQFNCEDCVFKNNQTTNPTSQTTRKGQGAAVFLNNRLMDATISTFTRCRFESNQASNEGGAIYNQDGIPQFKNCGFLKNIALNGGVVASYHSVQGSLAEPKFINCSFTGNKFRPPLGASSMGLASVARAERSRIHLINSIITGNGNDTGFEGGSFTVVDGVSSVSATSSLYNAQVMYITGDGNYTTTTSPFSNSATLEIRPCPPVLNGSSITFATTAQLGDKDLNGKTRRIDDNVDLGAVEFQTIPPQESAGGITTESGATGSFTICSAIPRLQVNPKKEGYAYGGFYWESKLGDGNWETIPDPTTTSAPSITLTGGTTRYIRRVANGCEVPNRTSNILSFYAPASSGNGGTISAPALIPHPLDIPLSFTNLVSATATTGPGAQITLSWQYSSDNGVTWTTLPNSNSQTLGLPDLAPQNNTTTFLYRRRITNGCGLDITSNHVSVNVIKRTSFISGKVASKNGTGVGNVLITVVRSTTGLAGSPGTKTYTVRTSNGEDLGNYQIPVYWGFPDSGPVDKSSFTITASYQSHTFSAPLTRLIGRGTPYPNEATDVNFTDSTAYAINGRVFQTCTDCLPETGMDIVNFGNGLLGCPIDSVQMEVRNSMGYYNSNRSHLDKGDGKYGRYSLIVDNPGSYTVSATYPTLAFVPVSPTMVITSDVYNLTFTSPTSRTITGRLTAGCSEKIGAATLEFSDVLPKAANGTERVCFKKQVKTDSDGFYWIALPPRTYTVKIVSYTANLGSGLNLEELNKVFNHSTFADSLVRDLTSSTVNTTLNLVYQRPPVLVIKGLPQKPACNTALPPIMEQAKPYALSVVVYQGPPANGCLVANRVTTTTATTGTGGSETANAPLSHTLLVQTDLKNGTNDKDTLTVTNGVASWSLTPGAPNVAGNFTRTLTAQYDDAYGRPVDDLQQTLIITGYRANRPTFATVSPSVPLMVLHDPPGDKSFSFWARNQTQSTALRFFTNKSDGSNKWWQVKLGYESSNGFGVEINSAVWATVDASRTATQRQSSAEETIVTTTYSEDVKTSDLSTVVGSSADLFVGGALNMICTTADVISLSQTTGGSCQVVSKQELVVGAKGFETQFYYTAWEIRNIYIKQLQAIVNASPPESSTAIEARRQINVWEQVLQDNENRKKAAPFDQNISFGGGVGSITKSLTKSQSKSNSIEFQMDIDEEMAGAAGLEIAGSGASGGASVTFRLETGESQTNTKFNEVTTGYTLSDDDLGDNWTVDVKTDPVYSTPVFEVIAGKTSCPPEEGTTPRDEFALSTPSTVLRNIAPDAVAVFPIVISNISQVSTDLPRRFAVLVDYSSNPNAAAVVINFLDGPISQTLATGTQMPFTVTVTRNPGLPYYSFEGIRIRVVDACSNADFNSRDVAPPLLLSAFFQNPCSSAELTTPEPGWVSSKNANNPLPIWIKGYTVENLNKITIQYSETGSNNWTNAFSLLPNQLTNSTTESVLDVSRLPDGPYSLRLAVECPTGNGSFATNYSLRSDGLIDRRAPEVFGNTLPVNDIYLPGNTIGITYDEPIACRRLTNANVTAKRLSNGQPVPFSVGCAGNQVVLTPQSSLFLGDVLSVTLTNVTDLYGNVRTTPDAWRFTVGSNTVVTGSRTVSVRSANSPLSESSTSPIRVTFPLSATSAQNVLVNYNLTGTASLGTDYTVTSGATATTGVIGSITIPKGTTGVTLLLYPINDQQYEPDETIIVSLLEGGDYSIGAPSAVTVVIQNDDPVPSPNVITSIRTGNWEDQDTWDLARLPLATDHVILDQNHTVTISSTGTARKLTPRLRSRLRFLLPKSKLRIGF